ncbi:MAG: DMT family transporter [bacterium]
MTWIIFAFGSVLLYTCVNLLQKRMAVESKYPRAMAILFNGIAGLFALLIFALTDSFKNFNLPSDSRAWIALAIASFCYAMYVRGRFVAAKLLDASVLATVTNISVLVAFIGSIFLYSESLTANKALGGILILGALFLVSFNNNKAKKLSVRGLLIATLISVILGIAWMLDKLGVQYFNANTYNIFVWIIPNIFIYLPYIRPDNIKSEWHIGSWKIVLLAGLSVVGYLLQLKSLELTEATKVIPILQMSTIFTVFMGIILLKERDNIAMKVIAGIMAMAGAYLLI